MMRSKSKFFVIGAVLAAASAAVIVAPTLTLAGIEEEEKKKDDEKKKSEAQIQKDAEAARTTRNAYARIVENAERLMAAAENEVATAKAFYDKARSAAENARNNNLLARADLETQADLTKAAWDAAEAKAKKAYADFVTANEAFFAKQNEASRLEQAAIDARKANEAKNKFALQSAAETRQQSATSSAVPAENVAANIAKVGAAIISELKRQQQAAQGAQRGGPPPPVPDRRLKPSRQNQAAGQAGAPNSQYDVVTHLVDYQNASTSQQKQ